MGNGKSRDSGSDEELDPAALTQRTEALTQKLAEFDEMIAAQPPTSEDESEEQSDYVSVIIGDSSMAEVPGMVKKIDEIASQSKSLGEVTIVASHVADVGSELFDCSMRCDVGWRWATTACAPTECCIWPSPKKRTSW